MNINIPGQIGPLEIEETIYFNLDKESKTLTIDVVIDGKCSSIMHIGPFEKHDSYYLLQALVNGTKKMQDFITDR